MRRRAAIALIAAALAPAALSPVLAHHGYMQWDKETPFVIEGWISKEMDGFPHWEIHVRVNSEDWEVDIGDQYQLEKAGLEPDGSDFRFKRDIRVEGWRPVDRNIRRVLPTRIIFDGDEAHDLVVRE